MNRKQEYRDLLASLDNAPPQLNTTLNRAQHRAAHRRQWHRLVLAPALCLTLLLGVFTGLVNLSPAFAAAMRDVPLLSSLALAVDLSPSVKAAADNGAAQQLNMTQTQNGVTITLKSLVADKRQLYVSYTISDADGKQLSATVSYHADGGALNNSSGSANPDRPADGDTLQYYALENYDKDLPPAVTLSFGITGENNVSLAFFKFTLDLSAAQPLSPKIYTLNQTATVDGQQLTVTTLEVYPTHTRVNIVTDERNTAALQALDLTMTDAAGHSYGAAAHSFGSFSNASEPNTFMFRLESPYFADASALTLHINGGEWREKQTVDVLLDAESLLPPGVTLLEASQPDADGVTTTVFEVDENKLSSQLPTGVTRTIDVDGIGYEKMRVGNDTTYTLTIKTVTPNTVRFVYTRTVKLPQPVTLNLPLP